MVTSGHSFTTTDQRDSALFPVTYIQLTQCTENFYYAFYSLHLQWSFSMPRLFSYCLLLLLKWHNAHGGRSTPYLWWNCFTVWNCGLWDKDSGISELTGYSRVISVESLLLWELYDGCYVVFMTFVIRTQDRLCNYDVLCRALALLKITAEFSSCIKFPQSFRAICNTESNNAASCYNFNTGASTFSSIYSGLRHALSCRH